MESFTSRLSNVLAWGGFIYIAIIISGVLITGKNTLIQELPAQTPSLTVYCSGLPSLTQQNIETLTEKELDEIIACHEAKIIHTYNFNALLNHLIITSLFYIPYIIIIVLNYLIVGRFRLLPWKKRPLPYESNAVE